MTKEVLKFGKDPRQFTTVEECPKGYEIWMHIRPEGAPYVHSVHEDKDKAIAWAKRLGDCDWIGMHKKEEEDMGRARRRAARLGLL